MRKKQNLEEKVWMDLQVSRGKDVAALQRIRYVQLLALSQRTPTIRVKMINITAG